LSRAICWDSRKRKAAVRTLSHLMDKLLHIWSLQMYGMHFCLAVILGMSQQMIYCLNFLVLFACQSRWHRCLTVIIKEIWRNNMHFILSVGYSQTEPHPNTSTFQF
jgi:hypothetical protein